MWSTRVWYRPCGIVHLNGWCCRAGCEATISILSAFASSQSNVAALVASQTLSHCAIHANNCLEMFPQVSRSFAAVIRQLPKVLVTDIVVFYLVLRGLDTVEDDMTAFEDIQVLYDNSSREGLLNSQISLE